MSHSKEIEKEFLENVRKHEGILHKICFVYSRSDLNKEDLYQEIILQLWKSYPSFRGQSEFSTWMYKVALNTAIGLTKKPSLLIFQNTKPSVTFEDDNYDDLSEDIKVLYKAISYLKKIEKAIILLWLEEKSYDEIANTIGISTKNVSVKLVRVKAKLAGLIEKLQ